VVKAVQKEGIHRMYSRDSRNLHGYVTGRNRMLDQFHGNSGLGLGSLSYQIYLHIHRRCTEEIG
jgi:hypothetical protein